MRQKKLTPARSQPRAPVHRYRVKRPWSVAGLAATAALMATLLTGAVAVNVPPAPSLRDVAGGAARHADAAWQVQLGTFTRRDVAEAHLRAMTIALPAILDYRLSPEPYQQLTRARVIGLPDEASAEALCAQVSGQGSECLVVAPGG